MGQSRKKPVVGWNEDVKSFRDSASFWHSIWLSCGRPLNCEVHNVMKRTRNIFHFQLRKCRRAEEKIKRCKLLNACLNGNENIFDEIKKLRRSKPAVANSIDGVTVNIPGHFANIYKQLYNSVNDQEEVLNISEQLENKISVSSLDDVNQVTAAKVKEATEKLKDGKSDPICDVSSDCIKNAPDILFDMLAIIIRSYLIHGHVSLFLLLATLVPIVKDKLANICSSKNYRSIAISLSLIHI